MSSTTAFLILNALVALLILVGLALSARKLAGLVSAIAFAALAIALGIGVWLGAPAIPDGWITPLQEGLTEKHVRAIYGDGAHAGSVFRGLVSWLAPETAGLPLRAVVRLNVALSIANTGLFLVIARRVLAWPAAIAFALVFALNPVALHAALSELPAALLTSYFLCGVATAGIAVDARLGRRARWVLAFAATGVGVLAALVRVETLALSLPAMASLVAILTLGGDRLAAWWLRVLAALKRVLARPTALIFAVLLAVWLLGTSLSVGLGFDFLDPLHVSAFALPATLTLFMPLGPAVLFLLGVIHALRNAPRFLLLPLGILLLYKAYYSAAHAATAPFELLRYMTIVTPVALFLALFGWREIVVLMRRLDWSEPGVRAARSLTALSFFCWTPAGFALFTDFNGAEPGFGLERFLVRRDQQIEVRWLLELVDRYPDCTFVSRVVPNGALPTERAHQEVAWQFIVFGRALPQPSSEPASERTVSEATFARAPKGCLIYYRGVDCNLSSAGDVCDRDAQPLRQLADKTPVNVPYYSHVELSPKARLAVYALRD